MKTTAEALIRGYGNAWKVADASDKGPLVERRVVEIEIQGDGKNGYHLIMTPKGCFTADTWHATVADAKDTAQEIFGVPMDGWS